jgi:dTDP-4-amino-4,6-dideoxygalactose transaminase
MTDIQAALGLSQMQRLDQFVEARNRWAAWYDEALGDLPIQRPHVADGTVSSWHLYTLRIKAPFERDALSQHMRQGGVGVNVHYMPVHLQPYYRDLGFQPGMFPEAEAHGREALTLPLFASMTDENFDKVVTTLRRALS